jgi:hypothetical protein
VSPTTKPWELGTPEVTVVMMPVDATRVPMVLLDALLDPTSMPVGFGFWFEK